MKIKDLFQKGKPTFSFEFFPPKTPEAEKQLYEAIERLRLLHPSFVSVTCGAMGTTKTKTAELSALIKEKLKTESMAHLTCVSADQSEIFSTLNGLKERGIKNILALRGDPPEGYSHFKRPENGFAYAAELVRFIREKFQDAFSIGVAGYPEGHPECPDKELDLKYLAEKVRAGGDFVITQLFLINENFFRFVERARKIGIRVPIVPGIMPITSANQLSIFAEKCGTQIPEKLRQDVLKFSSDKKALQQYGIEFATRQSEALLKEGVSGIHFYTLNRSQATVQIFKNLNLQTG
jgi:methylenetetrahydrofolate reductase (NADPH)